VEVIASGGPPLGQLRVYAWGARVYQYVTRDSGWDLRQGFSGREGAGLGVARQEQDCRALCERCGWTVAGVYPDNDVSAHSGDPNCTAGSRTQGRASRTPELTGGRGQPDRRTRHEAIRLRRDAAVTDRPSCRRERVPHQPNRSGSRLVQDIPRSWHDSHPPVSREPPSIAGGSASS
jgi:hypothetical protein